MTQPGWLSQSYPPEGASAAEGIRNQLGRPELDLLTILVRESAQNSWDARVPSSSVPVDFRIDMWTVGPAHTGTWRELLLAGAPTGRTGDFPLRETLRRGSVRVLAVSDRGTRGLGGPTRADDAVGPERDFVSFIRNIGEPRDTALGGGTYGFGKGIFYLLSTSGTILVHSRCRTARGDLETRLIGCTLWKSYVSTEDGLRYTGRHWWGDASGDVVEPLTGREADATAQRLGLKPFGPEETGTTIVVVDPILDGLDAVEAADYLAETIAWHLWPKMITTDDRPPAMRFSVTCDGVDRPVPDPRQTRPLDMFVAAYETMLGPKGTDLACLKPKRHLGRLGIVMKRAMLPLEPSRASRMLAIEDLIHHVCLMRPAELVVTYRPGPKPPSVNQGYAGVFRADVSMDDIYAKAEPPTHDAWNPQSLERPESTFVATTFRRIAESVDGLLSLSGVTRAGGSSVALGAASSMFSGLVGGAWGIGGATDYSKPGSTVARPTKKKGTDDRSSAVSDRTSAPDTSPSSEQEAGPGTPSSGGPRSVVRRPRVQYVGDPYYDDRGTTTVLVQEFRLPVPGPQRVRIDLAVTLPGTGGRETDPPIGASMPELVGWEDQAGQLYRSETYVIEGSESVWRAVVMPAPDTMTEIGVKVEAVRAS
ncbi:hypothetical protein [Streptomyces sp. NPDC059786]|uniref:hypothetical protein n=1 Tax=Streptomyces sp. NPDC059786 TaxID=3346946 RepID=UPI0036636C37